MLSSLAAIVTLVSANFYTALVVGLVAWILIAVLLLVVMSYRKQIPAPVGAGQNSPAQQNTSEQDRLRAEIREQERERQQLISRAEQRETEIERLQERNELLSAEKDALKERAEQTAKNLEAQPDDGELKQRCFRVSEGLFEFADERDETDPQKRPEQHPGVWNRSKKGGDHDEETKVQYSRRFGGEVGALLDVAEQRGWIATQERQKLEENAKATLSFTTVTARIREIAQRLERFGHRP